LFTWKEIIDIAVQIEKNGEKIYRRAAGQIADPDLSAALAHMAAEEARHAAWFEQMPRPGAVEPAHSDLDKMARIFIRDAMTDKALSLETADFTAMKNVRELIRTSLEFEEDTILFFEMIRQFADQKTIKTLLDAIIAEEKKHITTLKNWTGPKRLSTAAKLP